MYGAEPGNGHNNRVHAELGCSYFNQLNKEQSRHRCLQAWAYPGIAWVISNCVLLSRGSDAKTHGHQHIAYVGTDILIAYIVVTNTLSAIAHQMWHSQVSPGYPHDCAGAYMSQDTQRC